MVYNSVHNQRHDLDWIHPLLRLGGPHVKVGGHKAAGLETVCPTCKGFLLDDCTTPSEDYVCDLYMGFMRMCPCTKYRCDIGCGLYSEHISASDFK